MTRHRVLPGWRTLANAAHECVALGGEPLASSASPTSKAPTGTGISASASSVVGSRSVRSLAMRAALFLGVATTAAATNSSHGLDVDRDLRSAAQELMKSIAFDEEADPLQAVCGGALDAAMAAAAAMTPDESSQGEGDSTPARTDMHCAFDVHAMTLLPAIDELAARLKSAEVVLFPGDSPAPVLDSAPIAEMHEYAAAIPTFAPSARSLRRLHAWAMLLVSRNPSEDGSKGVSAVFTGVSGRIHLSMYSKMFREMTVVWNFAISRHRRGLMAARVLRLCRCQHRQSQALRSLPDGGVRLRSGD